MSRPLITIKAFQEEDLPASTAIRNMKQVRWGTLARPFESVAYWRGQSAGRAAPNRFLAAWAGGQMVGLASLHPMKPARRAHAASIGISVHPDWHGQGVGTALFAALTDLADNWLGLKRLELQVYTDNLPALALYKKFGFEVEATLRDETFRDGLFVDSHVMARLHGDLPLDSTPYPAAPPPRPKAAFTLRAAEPEDGAALAGIMSQPLVRHGTMALPFCTPADCAALIAPAPGGQAVMAVADGMPVGAALLTPGAGRRVHTAYITLLAVHDAYHGQGIGSALIEALLDVADNWLNIKRLALHVFADNAPALALYERYGFVREGLARRDGFRAGAYADAVLMARFKEGTAFL